MRPSSSYSYNTISYCTWQFYEGLCCRRASFLTTTTLRCDVVLIATFSWAQMPLSPRVNQLTYIVPTNASAYCKFDPCFLPTHFHKAFKATTLPFQGFLSPCLLLGFLPPEWREWDISVPNLGTLSVGKLTLCVVVPRPRGANEATSCAFFPYVRAIPNGTMGPSDRGGEGGRGTGLVG